jgi:hypothetical protein
MVIWLCACAALKQSPRKMLAAIARTALIRIELRPSREGSPIVAIALLASQVGLQCQKSVALIATSMSAFERLSLATN